MGFSKVSLIIGDYGVGFKKNLNDISTFLNLEVYIA
jgi:hypothetical protein